MQKLPLESEVFFCPDILRFKPVFLISEHRMSYIGHMHAYLMGTSGFERHLQEAELLSFIKKDFFHLVVCHRLPSVDGVSDGHLQTIVRVTSHDRFDRSDLVFRFSDNESEIGLLYLMVMYQLLELPKGDVIFCDQDESARLLVEPMDDSGAILTLFPVKVSDLSDELIHQCSESAEVAGRRMGVDARVFADDEEIVVFKNDFQGTMVRRKRRRYGLDVHLYHVSSFRIIFWAMMAPLEILFFVSDGDLSNRESFLYL